MSQPFPCGQWRRSRLALCGINYERSKKHQRRTSDLEQWQNVPPLSGLVSPIVQCCIRDAFLTGKIRDGHKMNQNIDEFESKAKNASNSDEKKYDEQIARLRDEARKKRNGLLEPVALPWISD